MGTCRPAPGTARIFCPGSAVRSTTVTPAHLSGNHRRWIYCRGAMPASSAHPFQAPGPGRDRCVRDTATPACRTAPRSPWGMIWQHHPAGSHANVFVPPAMCPNDDRRRGAGNARMLWCSASQKRRYPHSSACCASPRELRKASAGGRARAMGARSRTENGITQSS